MRKSNWVVVAIAIVAVAALLWLWYFLGFNRIDSPVDIVVAVVWWVVIALVIFAIKHAENKRREKMRVAFIGDGFLYNPEGGLMIPDPGESEIALLERTLASMTYPDKVVALDEERQLAFRWVVRSFKFDQDEEVWEGEVSPAHKPDQEPSTFESREQLVALLSA